MANWRMFIASSGKGLRYAQAIKAVIDDRFKAPVCFLWNQGAFETGRSFLDSLEQLPIKYNCGLAVFTGDDQLGDLLAPRDNVVLELGLFLGVFQRARSFVLVEDLEKLKVPSDYQGITVKRFYSLPAGASIEELHGAVQAACDDVIEHLNRLPSPGTHPEALERIEKNWRLRFPGKDFKLFSFCGLSDPHPDPLEGSGEEEVYYLWADAGAGSSIRAQVLDPDLPPGAKPEHILQVEFDNHSDGFPGNVAIRFRRRHVVSAAPNRFERLRFLARVPSGGTPALDAGTSVSMGIRIIDALTTHWEYCRVPHEYILMRVNAGEDWREFTIPLNDTTRWCVFASDGNYLYHDEGPDFSQIMAVVIEVGCKGKGRPGSGSGVLQLKDFTLE